MHTVWECSSELSSLERLLDLCLLEMEQLQVLGLQKWSDSGFLAYKKWSDSGFLACEKWSDSGFLACNYYEKFSVFLYFLPDFWFIQKTVYIRLVSESPFTTYVKTVLNDRIPLINAWFMFNFIFFFFYFFAGLSINIKHYQVTIIITLSGQHHNQPSRIASD